MTKTKQIEVVDYDPAWPVKFTGLQQVLQTHLKGLIADIQHVGSTSVPGLAAKPIIDIDLVIRSKSELQPVVEVLQVLGYRHEGEMGIPGRDAFSRPGVFIPDDGKGTVWPDHHLYCCPEDSFSFQNHIRFRDFLRQHPQIIAEYSELKKRLANEYPFDIDKYVELKTPFITGILAQEGFSKSAITAITMQNSISNNTANEDEPADKP